MINRPDEPRSGSGRERSRSGGAGHKLADRAGERSWLVPHDLRIAAGMSVSRGRKHSESVFNSRAELGGYGISRRMTGRSGGGERGTCVAGGQCEECGLRRTPHPAPPLYRAWSPRLNMKPSFLVIRARPPGTWASSTSVVDPALVTVAPAASPCQARSDHDHIPASSHTAQTGGPIRL
jgi:hypothetical protein